MDQAAAAMEARDWVLGAVPTEGGQAPGGAGGCSLSRYPPRTGPRDSENRDLGGSFLTCDHLSPPRQEHGGRGPREGQRPGESPMESDSQSAPIATLTRTLFMGTRAGNLLGLGWGRVHRCFGSKGVEEP